MYTIAYDKDTKRILGFIKANEPINSFEVFSGFQNYLIKETDAMPPTIDFDNYVLNEENEEVSFDRYTPLLSEAEEISNKIKTLRGQLRETNDTAFEFLEGDLTVLEFTEIKLQRRNIRSQIRQLQERLKNL